MAMTNDGDVSEHLRTKPGELTAKSLETALFQKVEKVLTFAPDTELFVTGHSLGGALSVLCGIRLALKFPNKNVQVINFGCPKVGNAAFAKLVNTTPNLCVQRVVHKRDIITRVPNLDFNHVGHYSDRRGGGRQAARSQVARRPSRDDQLEPDDGTREPPPHGGLPQSVELARRRQEAVGGRLQRLVMICYAAERRESPESHTVERRSGRGCVCERGGCGAGERGCWQLGGVGWRCRRCVLSTTSCVVLVLSPLLCFDARSAAQTKK